MWGRQRRESEGAGEGGDRAWGRWRRQPHDWDNGDMTAPGTYRGSAPAAAEAYYRLFSSAFLLFCSFARALSFTRAIAQLRQNHFRRY